MLTGRISAGDLSRPSYSTPCWSRVRAAPSARRSATCSAPRAQLNAWPSCVPSAVDRRAGKPQAASQARPRRGVVRERVVPLSHAGRVAGARPLRPAVAPGRDRGDRRVHRDPARPRPQPLLRFYDPEKGKCSPRRKSTFGACAGRPAALAGDRSAGSDPVQCLCVRQHPLRASRRQRRRGQSGRRGGVGTDLHRGPAQRLRDRPRRARVRCRRTAPAHRHR